MKFLRKINEVILVWPFNVLPLSRWRHFDVNVSDKLRAAARCRHNQLRVYRHVQWRRGHCVKHDHVWHRWRQWGSQVPASGVFYLGRRGRCMFSIRISLVSFLFHFFLCSLILNNYKTSDLGRYYRKTLFRRISVVIVSLTSSINLWNLTFLLSRDVVS